MSATQILEAFIISIILTTLFLGRPLARLGQGTLKSHLLIATGLTSLVFLNRTFEWGLQPIFITFMAAWLLLRFAFGAMWKSQFGQKTPFLFLIPAAIYTLTTLGSGAGIHVIAGLGVGGLGLLLNLSNSPTSSTSTSYRDDPDYPNQQTCYSCGQLYCQCARLAEQERFAEQEREWEERRAAEEQRWREIQEEKQRNYDDGERNIFHI